MCPSVPLVRSSQTSYLSKEGFYGITVTVGNKIFFTGQFVRVNSRHITNDIIDMYDYDSNVFTRNVARIIGMNEYSVGVAVGIHVYYMISENNNVIKKFDTVGYTITDLIVTFPVGFKVRLYMSSAVAIGNRIIYRGYNSGNYYVLFNTDTLAVSNQIPCLSGATGSNDGVASVSNDRVALFLGGTRSPNVVEIYSVATNAWTSTSLSLSLSRQYPSAVLFNDLVYVAGTGSSNDGNYAEIYNISFSTWSIMNYPSNFDPSIDNYEGKIKMSLVGCKVIFFAPASLISFDVNSQAWGPVISFQSNYFPVFPLVGSVGYTLVVAAGFREGDTTVTYFSFCSSCMIALMIPIYL